MADPQDIEDLEFLVARIGMPTVHQQAGFVQNTVAFDMPMEEDYELPPAAQRLARPIALERGKAGVDVVNVQLGGTGGLGTYNDGSARPAGQGRPKEQGRKLPVLLGATLKFDIAEVDIAKGGDDSIDSVLSTLRAHGSQVGAYLARSLNDPQVDEPAADVTIGSTTFTVQDVSGWLEGQSYEVRNDTSGLVTQTFTVSLVTPAFDGTAVITVSSALTAAIDVSDESIYLLGQGDSDKAFGSIKDFTDSSLDLYGLDRTTIFPAGLEEDVSGAWSNEDGKRLVSMLKAIGDYPTHWLTGVNGADKIVNAQNDNVRFIPGEGANKRDPFYDAMVPEFCGLPIIACPQAGDNTINLGNFDKMMFREHAAYKPRMANGVARGEYGKAALFNSEDLFALKMLMDGFYATVCTRRRAFARFINVTA